MSAPTATLPSEHLPSETPIAEPSVNGKTVGHISPQGAGIAGAALGFGAGLVLAELVVPGLILGVVALGGLATAGSISRFVRRRSPVVGAATRS